MVNKRLKVGTILAGVALLGVIAYVAGKKDDQARFIRAVQDGDVNTVAGLLSKNSELALMELRGKGGTTPVLYIAISGGRKEIVRLILSHGANPKSYPHALWFAKNKETAELLIEHGADVNWQDEYGYAALHSFAAMDNTPMAEFFISHGANVNVRDNGGETPLHRAAREGCLNAAKLLVSKGADLSVRSRENKTPFDHAVMPVWNEDAYRLEHGRIRRCKEVAAYLLACGSTATIFDLAWLGDMQRVAAIVKSTPSVVNERANGEPLLFAAVRGGNADVVEYLLTHGAQLEVTGRFKQSPLQLTSYIGYTDVARVLLDNGADIGEKGPWGETALHWAAVRGNTDVAALLLERGADANSQTSSHTVDLNVNVRASDVDPIERELSWFKTQEMQRGNPRLQVMYPPRVAFARGDTPIHAATYWNHVDIVRLLIDNGADINRTNCWGATPLHYAVVCRYHDIAQMLLESGADPEAKTRSGMTPIEIARKVKDNNLVSLLSNRKYQ